MQNHGWAIAMLAALIAAGVAPAPASAAFFVEFGSTHEVLAGQSSSTSSSTTATSLGGFVPVPVEDGATALGTRLAFNVNADAGPDLVALEPAVLSFRVGFGVAHLQAYDLTIAVEMNGQLRRLADNPGCQGSISLADIRLPTLRRFADGAEFPLDIVLPGAALDLGAGDAVATLRADAVRTLQFRNQTTDGDGFTIDFLVTATAISQSCEVSARFGADNGSTTNCSACQYPGDGQRVLADDGIAVAVIVTNLCGNGTVEAGEECDAGDQNGERTSCCDRCRIVRPGPVCRPAADDCDSPEICDGDSGFCPADTKKPPGSACTDDQNVCTDDVCSESATCVHVPLEGAFCDDALFCNGELRCSARGQCEDLIPPPCPAERCDEVNDACAAVTLTPTATPTPPPGGTPSATPTVTASGAPTAPPGTCAGDCNADGAVAINELVLGVNVALGNQPVAACAAFDTDADGAVKINELVAGVGNAQAGCRP